MFSDTTQLPQLASGGSTSSSSRSSLRSLSSFNAFLGSSPPEDASQSLHEVDASFPGLRLDSHRHRPSSAAVSFLFTSNGEEESANFDSSHLEAMPRQSFRRNIPLALNQDSILLPSSFSGDSEHNAAVDGAVAVEKDLEHIATDPTKLLDFEVWSKLMTDVAVICNYGALTLTFLGAAYHAWGYVQFQNAQKQDARDRERRAD
eukprot:TRINITY_DN12529_c0_g1_i1.p1 TRINITY_DN12529_c0_g1~~TRINITY_DN12529_c0_g1_i1.p1  ORF type:complete len:204 (+),score=28.03 TRINITY_DN12529_c0_g1_i1:70-681(+)